MSEFLRYVLYELKNSIVLVLLAGIAAAAVTAAAYFVHKRKYKGEKKFPWGRVLLWLVFLGYGCVVLYATLLRWTGFPHREWNLHLFRAWREAWNNFSTKNWANVLLNVAMFGPLGFLLPLMGKKFRRWYVTVPVGFGISLAIELLQLAMGRGICDVDDLFCNGLGALMGYLAVMTVLSLCNGKGKRIRPTLVYGSLFLITVMAIGSIFVGYELKEYGNLPNAAAYTNHTGDTVWELACELPAEKAEAPYTGPKPAPSKTVMPLRKNSERSSERSITPSPITRRLRTTWTNPAMKTGPIFSLFPIWTPAMNILLDWGIIRFGAMLTGKPLRLHYPAFLCLFLRMPCLRWRERAGTVFPWSSI